MTWDSPIWSGVPANVSGQGEYQTMMYRGAEAGQAAFDVHRRTWITEGHIEHIAASGLNLVRVPVGYWIQGCNYLDTLVREWAVQHNVAVLISIHGAPGSQNGADHSAPATPGAHWSDSDENVAATRRLVTFLAARYLHDDAFLGISLLNEPAGGTDVNVLTQYYDNVYNDVRSGVGSDCILVTAPLLWCQNSGSGVCSMDKFGPDMTNVWHDWHPYVVWGYDAMTEDQIITQGVGGWATAIRQWNGSHPLFLGEWCFTGPGGKFSTEASTKALVHAMVDMWPSQDVSPAGLALRGVTGYFTGDPSRVNKVLVQDATWMMQFGVTVMERWMYNRRTLQLRSTRFGDCLDGYFDTSRQVYRVHMWSCAASNVNQKWKLERHQIVHVSFLLCLSVAALEMTLQRCDASDAAQVWTTKERVMLALPMRQRVGVGAQGQLVQAFMPDDNLMWQPPALTWLVDYEAQSISNATTGQCLEAASSKPPASGNISVSMQPCERGRATQKWIVDHLHQHLVFLDRFCLAMAAASSSQLMVCDPIDPGQRIRLEWLEYPEV
ncbi:hypothetical protein DYB38_005586 [Aphanomyces astaci]|uniref:glucan 1,3-beta-glucosidase n=1 Tax=Aphanomyces astaci TaxID=112090 RepID=A0A397DIP4_APHAT|nr:hypothetical protein DYB38_005586 [Aphanomyces astaci]